MRSMAVPFASQEWQKKTPFSMFTDIEGRRSPWAGQQTIASPQREPVSSTP